MKDTPWDAYKSNQPVTSYNPQFGTPALSLPSGKSGKLRKGRVTVAIMVVLLLLATVAFTPHGIWLFLHSLAPLFTPTGGRAIAFALLVLSVIGGGAWLVITVGGDFVGFVLMAAALAIFCVASFGGYTGLFSTFATTWTIIGSFALAVVGYQIFDNFDFPVTPRPAPTPVPPALPVHAPSNNVYGSGRSATPHELHEAWSGNSPSNTGGFDRMFED